MSSTSIDKKANFLATCLLESLEDEDLRAAKLFLEKYDCNPNTVIFRRGIAPIHYACGMENLAIAEEVMELMLKRGGDPNVRSEDDMTPLHVACLTGHSNIVKMLLQHGGDIHLTDAEKKTPVLYAVHEHHLEVIQTIQNHVFEMKFANKKKEFLLSANTHNIQSPRNKNLLSVQQLEEKKYTPNRVHYNFDVTSPYYIYITHRKMNSNKRTQPVGLNEMPPPPSQIVERKENLFKLTEENLDRYSEQLSPVQSRLSLIQFWREKVQRSRQRSSILKVFNDIDGLLDGVMNEETLNFTNTVLEPKKEPEEKPMSGKSIANFLGNLVVHDMQEELSFVTAEDKLDNINGALSESDFIKSPLTGQYVLQVAETYAHTDDENGLVFYETRLHSNPGTRTKDVQRKSCESANLTLPPDYDTDTLRAELTTFGETPGPITKNTKRLYLKRLIKYKRNMSAQNNETIIEQKFSVELERTVLRKEWFDRVQEHMPLEREINQHFNVNGQKRKFREGTMKTSFIYLLIDPRVSKNLPGEFKYMPEHDVWRRFLNAIFYVGKGKSSRPYSHLYDAMKIFSRNRDHFNFAENLDTEAHQTQSPGRILQISQKRLTESQKLQRILDIWQSKRGVVCLHVFHNIMPAEAYTREAAIIDALGLKHLTNMKRGDYYGPSQTWTMRSKKFLGIALLFKAMQIFLAEGESQLTPSDLI